MCVCVDSNTIHLRFATETHFANGQRGSATPSWVSFRLNWFLIHFFETFTEGSTESDTVQRNLAQSTWTTSAAAAAAAAQFTVEGGGRNYFGDSWSASGHLLPASLADKQHTLPGREIIELWSCFALFPSSLSLSLSLALLAKPNQLWHRCCRFPLISPRSPEHWWRALKKCTISREPTSVQRTTKNKKTTTFCLHWVAHPCNHWQPFGWKTACSLWVIGTSLVLENESDHPEGTLGSQLESSIKPGNILLGGGRLICWSRLAWTFFLKKKKKIKNATHCGAANNNEASITDEVSRWGVNISGKWKGEELFRRLGKFLVWLRTSWHNDDN